MPAYMIWIQKHCSNYDTAMNSRWQSWYSSINYCEAKGPQHNYSKATIRTLTDIVLHRTKPFTAAALVKSCPSFGWSTSAQNISTLQTCVQAHAAVLAPSRKISKYGEGQHKTWLEWPLCCMDGKIYTVHCYIRCAHGALVSRCLVEPSPMNLCWPEKDAMGWEDLHWETTAPVFLGASRGSRAPGCHVQ